MFLASDDDGATAEIGALAEKLGFAPINLGGLSEGGLLVHARKRTWILPWRTRSAGRRRRSATGAAAPTAHTSCRLSLWPWVSKKPERLRLSAARGSYDRVARSVSVSPHGRD